MQKNFAKMGDGSKVHLEEYVKLIALGHPEVDIYIGCDSQNYTDKTVYVTTILFRYENKGAHVLYHKEFVPRIRDMWTRLWAETERSIELAVYLEEKCGVKIKQIDMDYNSSPEHASSKLVNPAMGYAESMGFKASVKPNLLMATWAADVLCH